MVFYYQIHPPNARQKNWLSTHAPILRVIFKRYPDEWQQSQRQAQAQSQTRSIDYSDIDKLSKIKNSLGYRENIAAKSYLARILKDRTDIFPPTLILSSNGIEPTSKRAKWLFDRNVNSKYYLKPDKGFAGQGISIIARPQEALKITGRTKTKNSKIINDNFIFSSAKNLSQTTNSKTYILQQTIPRIHLYPGDRKYEYRIWVLAVWQKSQLQNRIRFYFYQDAVMRLTAVPYDSGSFKTEGNITTSSYYYKDLGVYKSDLFSRQPYFDQVFPRAQEIAKLIVTLIRPELRIQGEQGFEIFGFDFLNQYARAESETEAENIESETIESETERQLNPVLIEINRHIGYYTYPPGVHAPWVTEANMAMMDDLVKLVMKPMLEHRALPTNQGLWQQVLEL